MHCIPCVRAGRGWPNQWRQRLSERIPYVSDREEFADQGFTEIQEMFAKQSNPIPLDYMAKPSARAGGHRPTPSLRRGRSAGTFRKGTKIGYCYVGFRSDGAVKIGISTKPPKRASQVDVTLYFFIAVEPKAALSVETEALRLCGNGRDDGEWVKVTVQEAVSAVMQARENVERFAKVDPAVSEEISRRKRISLAKG